jgi:hypothetical protein
MRIPTHLLAQANKARPLILAGIAINLLMWLAHPANADTFSFTGDLRADATFLPPDPPPFTDGDYAQFAAVVRTFNVSSTSLMEAITFSYGGGTNGNGMVIAQGGFEPYLSLFDSGGNFMASTFFGVTCPSGAQTNSTSGQCFDVLLDGGTLAAGNYQIAISAFENLSFAENLGVGTLADGFTGLGNLAQGEDLHYAFDVILTSPVPEPAAGPLLAGAAIVLYLFNGKKKGRS